MPETDTAIIYSEQDVGLILDINKALANDGDITKRGIKECWWRYFTIPNIVIEKWLNEYGLDVYNKDHWKDVFKKVNEPEWKWLKTTSKMHWG